MSDGRKVKPRGKSAEHATSPDAPAKGPAPERCAPSAAAAEPPANAYVDAVEGHVARILIQVGDDDWQPYQLPCAILPPRLREGQWLSIQANPVGAPPGAVSARSLRQQLGADDDGGDLSL